MKTILLTLALLLFPAVAIRAQSIEACSANNNAPPVGYYYWPANAEVKVYLVRGMFTPEQQQTLLNAMDGWTEAAKETGADVKFAYAGQSNGLIDCHSCLTVTRQEVFKNDRKHYAFFYPLRRSKDGLLVSAWIDFDFATISPQALQGYMAHELGHGMGLGDCVSCKRKKTIMSGFQSINKDNGLTAPSACDLEVVRRIYEQQPRVAFNAVDAASALPSDTASAARRE